MTMTPSTIMSMAPNAGTGDRLVPRHVPASDPDHALADGMLSHYLSQARAAEQVRRVIAASGLALDEDDGA